MNCIRRPMCAFLSARIKCICTFEQTDSAMYKNDNDAVIAVVKMALMASVTAAYRPRSPSTSDEKAVYIAWKNLKFYHRQPCTQRNCEQRTLKLDYRIQVCASAHNGSIRGYWRKIHFSKFYMYTSAAYNMPTAMSCNESAPATCI